MTEKLTRYHVRGELRITGFGHGPISEPESAQMYMACEVDAEIERLRAQAEAEVARWQNAAVDAQEEAERLSAALRRLAQEVVDEDRRTVGPEGPSGELLDLAEKALGSVHEPPAPRDPLDWYVPQCQHYWDTHDKRCLLREGHAGEHFFGDAEKAPL